MKKLFITPEFLFGIAVGAQLVVIMSIVVSSFVTNGNQDLIKKCEESLPGNQNCQLIAVPIEN